jgi:4'-phosphopantetheinyl transferase
MVAMDEGDVHIWYCETTALGSTELNAADADLSPDERARRDRFHFERDRRDFMMAHALLRRALSSCAGVDPAHWRFVTDRYGKPSVDTADGRLPALSFNLSHTAGCVACAVTAIAPVGIDVERTDRMTEIHDIADRYFSPEEARALRDCPADMLNARFAEIWTFKEAFLKATGVGLSGSLSEMTFRFDDRSGIHFIAPPSMAPAEWHFVLFAPVANMRLAVAVRGAARPRFIMHAPTHGGEAAVPVRTSN